MTTPKDALIKIRRQIRATKIHCEENPDWQGSKDILTLLRKRELALANQIQVGNLKAEIERARAI